MSQSAGRRRCSRENVDAHMAGTLDGLMVVVTGQRLARDPRRRVRALRARPVVYALLVAIGRLVSQRVIGRRVESDRE